MTGGSPLVARLIEKQVELESCNRRPRVASPVDLDQHGNFGIVTDLLLDECPGDPGRSGAERRAISAAGCGMLSQKRGEPISDDPRDIIYGMEAPLQFSKS